MVNTRFVRKEDWKAVMSLYNAWRTEDGSSAVRDSILSLKQAKKRIVQILKSKNGFGLVAEQKGKIVGFIEANQGGFVKTHHSMFVNDIIIFKEHRRKGFGQALINRIIKITKQKKLKLIYLFVASNNKPAIKFYLTCGFKKTGRIIKGYKFGNKYVDKNIMCKLL